MPRFLPFNFNPIVSRKNLRAIKTWVMGIQALWVFTALYAQSDYRTPYYFVTVAGTIGGPGYTDGSATDARFNQPQGVAVDHSGNVYVADSRNHTIRKITPGGVVSTLAGSSGVPGNTDGTGSAARFYFPQALVVDATGNVYVSDTYNYTIRKITSAGVVTTLAGQAGLSGSADGVGTDARFYNPTGLAIDVNGDLLVADTYNNVIRKITPLGNVTTLAGVAGVSGSLDGTAAEARFNGPGGLATDGIGNTYVADTGNKTIRKITPTGMVTTFAGAAGEAGSADGTVSAARFSEPLGLTMDVSGNLFVTDVTNFTVRKISPAGAVTTIAGTVGVMGAADGLGTNAQFCFPWGAAVDATGNVYIADRGNPIENRFGNMVRKIDSSGKVTTFAGVAGISGSTDGVGSNARFYCPQGVVLDAGGNIFVTDTLNHTIRKIAPSGAVTTIAGSPTQVGSVDGTGSAARFAAPDGIAINREGDLVVVDVWNQTIRKVTGAGVVSTLAGAAGVAGSADGPGGDARFKDPRGIVVTDSGDMFVTDFSNHTIRKITPAGVVSTLAGLAGTPGRADGTGSDARFDGPCGITADNAGNLFVTELGNHIIRKVTTAGVVTTLAGNPTLGGDADGSSAEARFAAPTGIVRDRSGNLFVADETNHTIRKISPAGTVVTLAGVSGALGCADGTGREARFYFPQGLALDSEDNLYVANALDHNIRKGLAAGAPVIATQPKNQTVIAGSSFSASVIAAAAPPPSYQWYFNGQAFSGATGATLSFPNARASDAGDYTVVVSNSLGSVTSSKATLTVSSDSTTSPTPGGSTSGSSGGGANGAWFVSALLAFGLVRFQARRQ